jgi:hypothetical protein
MPQLPSWCPNLNGEQITRSLTGSHNAGKAPDGSSWSHVARGVNLGLPTHLIKVVGFDLTKVIATKSLTQLNRLLKGEVSASNAELALQHLDEVQKLATDAMKAQVAQHHCHMDYKKVLVNGVYEIIQPGKSLKRFDFEEGYALSVQWLRRVVEGPAGRSDLPNKPVYLHKLETTCYGRSLFVTDDGRIGIGHPLVQKDDHICILAEVSCPMILRPKIHDDCGTIWEIVGQAYCDGVMDGEIYDLRDLECGFDDFVLI